MRKDNTNFLRLQEICWADVEYQSMMEEFRSLTPRVECVLDQLNPDQRALLGEYLCLSRLMGVRIMMLSGEKVTFPGGVSGQQKALRR